MRDASHASYRVWLVTNPVVTWHACPRHGCRQEAQVWPGQSPRAPGMATSPEGNGHVVAKKHRCGRGKVLVPRKRDVAPRTGAKRLIPNLGRRVVRAAPSS
jgi:hypothetical protein